MTNVFVNHVPGWFSLVWLKQIRHHLVHVFDENRHLGLSEPLATTLLVVCDPSFLCHLSRHQESIKANTNCSWWSLESSARSISKGRIDIIANRAATHYLTLSKFSETFLKLFSMLVVVVISIYSSHSVLCEEARVVKRVHLLLGGVRSVANALKVVEEVQEEVQEIKDELEDEEVEENGGLKVEEKRSSDAWMRWRARHRWAMRCDVNHDDANLTNKQEICAPTCQCSCALRWRCHWCRARFHQADAIPSTEFFPLEVCCQIVHL